MLKRALIVAPILLILAGSRSSVAENAPSVTQSVQRPGQTARRLSAVAELQIKARKNIENAESALQADQRALEQLRQEEAVLRHAAVAKSGSWIEPDELWKRKEALKQSIKHKQHVLETARRYAKLAETHFRSVAESNASRAHRPSWFEHWWKW